MTKLLARLRRSFSASAGEVVFGMEDGAVSIFGLVFGVAATTNQTTHVLVAGITGAFAAAVSMMAGVFLDRQSEWMLVSDLFASLVPVVPFALLSMTDARVASILLTAALMLMLGAWGARLGRRRALPTALTTLAIAGAAGLVGLVTGQLVNGWFGAH